MDNEIGKAIHLAIEQSNMCSDTKTANHAAVDREIAERNRQIKDRQAKAIIKKRRAARLLLIQRNNSELPKVEQ